MTDPTSWNAAIDAAAEAIHTAPVFPRAEKPSSPRLDAERLIVLDIAAKAVLKLKRPNPVDIPRVAQSSGTESMAQSGGTAHSHSRDSRTIQGGEDAGS